MILRVQCGVTWKWLDERSGENYIIVFYFQKYKNKAKT